MITLYLMEGLQLVQKVCASAWYTDLWWKWWCDRLLCAQRSLGCHNWRRNSVPMWTWQRSGCIRQMMCWKTALSLVTSHERFSLRAPCFCVNAAQYGPRSPSPSAIWQISWPWTSHPTSLYPFNILAHVSFASESADHLRLAIVGGAIIAYHDWSTRTGFGPGPIFRDSRTWISLRCL